MSEYVYLKGKASWVRADAINERGKWSMMLHPDNESLEIIRGLQAEGCKNVIGKDDDGYNIRLSRPAEVKFRGSLKGMTPPQI